MAATLDGVNQDIDLTAHQAALETSQGALSLWFNYTNATLGAVMGWGEAGGTNFGDLRLGGNLTGGLADESIGWVGVNSTVEFYIRKGEGFYADGIWHNVIAVLDGIDNRFYMDGVKEAITFQNGNATSSNGFLTTANFDSIAIGRRFFSGSSLFFDGNVADVRIYTKFITDAEAKIIFESKGTDGITDTMKARYILNEGTSGATITNPIDYSGNSRDGSASNSPTYLEAPFRVSR